MPDRPDLAAMIVPLGRTLMAIERPILESHGLTMWAYGVLLGLEESPVRTQSALAKAIGADKTRIIATLDDLQDRGLITRTPDPTDRRARLLSLTSAGRELRDSAQAAIHHQENELLAALSPDDRRGFLRALQQLSEPADPTLGNS
ncbi:MarR family transcriptional regulator [Nocardia cyriacigeorgica]|uniref:MarR family transcriptional regulator n=1 Tax=Nocardia cyriacigeorgica TaxID=135487 RepID=A0A6P1D9L1_9NOCA|nr:MarR family transcriptional regulator [Nocardia cyriacigeorgica]NEW40845.1 MarR family transcriptional regulator [Nocardia cyriacigeorgica]NEW45914.1 MarR family transcriptional regulator [Nocardia cyriacigeorgica]NEW50945.1 MarR family transcriptional regulator [Nocardia cyriacigeorgica]NEW55685.1 MarR family transcriptional regulator [Nocardia cyriacigeorgica]